jgi:hypothetical protein
VIRKVAGKDDQGNLRLKIEDLRFEESACGGDVFNN